MFRKIINKILKIIILFAMGGILVLFFTALKNLTFLLIFALLALLLVSYVTIRINRIGDSKKGTKIIRGRVYAENPLYAYLEGGKVVYEYYEEIEVVDPTNKLSKVNTLFEEERMGEDLYIKDDFGKILLDGENLELKKFKIRTWLSEIKESNAHWHAKSTGNITAIEHDELLQGQSVVAVGQLSTNHDGQRILSKFEDQPYFIASTGQFQTLCRGRLIVYHFWCLLILMAVISTVLYYMPSDWLVIIENFVISVFGDHWQQLLDATIQQPRKVVIAFLKYIVASLPFIILIFFKTPIFQRVIMPIIYANLSWLALMFCAFAIFHIFLLNITIMWLMLGILYCVLLIYFLIYINYLRTKERQDINYME